MKDEGERLSQERSAEKTAAPALGETEVDGQEVLSEVDVLDAPTSIHSVVLPRLAVPPNWSSSPALSHLGTSTSPASISTSTISSPSSSPSSSSSSSAASSSYRFEWAKHKGYFLLPSSLYSRHSVRTTTVTLSASHPSFGAFPLSFLTYHLFGYDSIVLNHLLRQRSEGFMRNADTRDITPLAMAAKDEAATNATSAAGDKAPSTLTPSNSPALSVTRLLHLLYLLFFKSELLVTTLFLFFATTTLVSSTLTQTQLQMLQFSDALRQHLRLHLPIVGLVLEHTMHSLSFVPVVAGILFFLFEFFNDQLLAFLLLITVWLCESYTVLFTRTSTSMLYFPKLFALYFLMFGVYFFSFPYGFHYLAMSLTASQLYTCMAYYFFHFEIPAVEHGLISIHRPRMLVLRRNDGEELQRRGPAAAGAAPVDGRAGTGSRSSLSASASGGAGGRWQSRDSEHLLVRLLGLWDERQREEVEEELPVPVAEVSSAAVADEGEGDALDFSRREVRRMSHPPREQRASSAGPMVPTLSASSTTSLQPSSASSAATSPPWRPMQMPPSADSSSASSTFTLESFVPPSLTVSLPSFPSQPLSPSPAPLTLQVTPSPFTSRSSSATSSTSSTSQPSSPPPGLPASFVPLSASASTSDAVRHLLSLPPLLTQLLSAVQSVTSPPSTHSHRSASRRTRALSSHSASLSPSPKEASHSPSPSPSRSRRSSNPPYPLHPHLSHLPPQFESKEEAPISPEPASVPRLPHSPPPIPLLHTLHDTASLHRAVLEQLAHVLQVSLFVLTALQLNPSAPHVLPVGVPLLLPPHSTEALRSLSSSPPSVSPSSPPPRSPVRSFSSSPRSSRPHGSPSSSRQPLPHDSSASPSSATRRLQFTALQPSTEEMKSEGEGTVSGAPLPPAAVGGVDAVVQDSGGQGQRVQRRPVVEPPSPDPSADAPMM